VCLITLIRGHFQVFKTILTDYYNATLNVSFIYFLGQHKPNAFGCLIFTINHLIVIVTVFDIEFQNP